jgi:hypothetical protein
MLTRTAEGVGPDLRPPGRKGNAMPRDEYTPEAAVM